MAPQGDNLEASNGLDCRIARRAVAGARIGITAPSALWTGEVLLARSIDGFVCVKGSEAEKPESVRERLATFNEKSYQLKQ